MSGSVQLPSKRNADRVLQTNFVSQASDLDISRFWTVEDLVCHSRQMLEPSASALKLFFSLERKLKQDVVLYTQYRFIQSVETSTSKIG